MTDIVRRIALSWGISFVVVTGFVARSDLTGTVEHVLISVGLLAILVGLWWKPAVGLALTVVGGALLVWFGDHRLLGPAVLAPILAASATGLMRFHSEDGTVRGPRRAGPSALMALPLVVSVIMDFVIADGRPADWRVQTPGLTAVPPEVFLLGPGSPFLLAAWLLPRPWEWLERRTAGVTSVLRTGVGWAAKIVQRVFTFLARVITVPIVGLAFLVSVVAPWAFQRLTFGDPMWAPVRPGSRWVKRSQPDGGATAAMWFRDSGARSAVRTHRWVRAVPTLAAAVAFAFLAREIAPRIDWPEWGADDVASDRGTPADETPEDGPPDAAPPSVPEGSALEAITSESWYPSWDRSFGRLGSKSTVEQYAGIEYPDFSSDYLNVTGGARATWSDVPTTCEDPVEVWMFGGSTLFGVGQRDMFTIPSEVARVAKANGVALDVVNWAIPGDVGWIEQRRLERAMAITGRTPDVVVFYDGFNDVRAVEWAYMAGQDVRGKFLSLLDRDVMPLLRRFVEVVEDGERRLVAEPVDINQRSVDEDELLDASNVQYVTAHDLVASFLATRDIPFVHYFQPMAATRAEPANGDFVVSDAAIERMKRFRERLPEGIIDIADVFDSTDDAYYVDDVHTNEIANEVVAERMWEDLQRVVAGLPAGQGGAGCS